MAGETALNSPNSPVDPLLIGARAGVLALHSPYHFLRTLPLAPQQEEFGTGAAFRFASESYAQVLPMASGSGQWLLQKLSWDTDFFGAPTYRLFTGLFSASTTADVLTDSAAALRRQLAQQGRYYAFSIVPAEDIRLLQALSSAGWRLVETRLNFYRPTAEPLPLAPVAVRLAHVEEAVHLGQVSAAARNQFDRFHADPWFGSERADAFLARYAEAAVASKYADAVLVPDETGTAVDSFMAIKDIQPDPNLPGSGYSRILLAAAGSQNRGWHLKLMAETVRRAVAQQLPYVLMTTQSTNRAVLRNCEKLGFRLGSTSHVLACSLT